MDFVFEQLRVGGDRNFAYLLGDRHAGVAAAVDPAWDPDLVAERAAAQGLAIRWLVNTHGHDDHTNGNAALLARTQATLAAHPAAASDPERKLGDGDVLEVGSLRVRILHVPGHADDHLLLWLEEEAVVLTGDLLFVGKIGGTATDEDARAERESLLRVLDTLPDTTMVWPGHDYGCRPASTIRLEKRTNPFLEALDDADAFLRLKKDWPAFKQKHGLR